MRVCVCMSMCACVPVCPFHFMLCFARPQATPNAHKGQGWEKFTSAAIAGIIALLVLDDRVSVRFRAYRPCHLASAVSIFDCHFRLKPCTFPSLLSSAAINAQRKDVVFMLWGKPAQVSAVYKLQRRSYSLVILIHSTGCRLSR